MTYTSDENDERIGQFERVRENIDSIAEDPLGLLPEWKMLWMHLEEKMPVPGKPPSCPLGPRPWIFRPRLVLSFCLPPLLSYLSFFSSRAMRPFWRSGYRCYARRAPRRSTDRSTKSYEDSRGCTIMCTGGCATVLRYLSGWCPAVMRIDLRYAVNFSFAPIRNKQDDTEICKSIVKLKADRWRNVRRVSIGLYPSPFLRRNQTTSNLSTL